MLYPWTPCKTYHPGTVQVSGAKTGYKPSLGQYRLYNALFGYLTAPPGFCKPLSTDQCHVFAVLNDEFG